MSTTIKAHLIYGFKIDDEDIVDGIDNDYVKVDDGLTIVNGGSEYCDNISTFICLTNYYQYMEENALKVNHNTDKNDDKLLLSWARRHGIKNPNIDWWLFVEEI